MTAIILQMRLWPLYAFFATTAWGGDWFLGAMGGLSTLSADARIVGSPPVSISAYKPENGPTLQVFAGRDLTRYISAQASYAWNRNSVSLSGADVGSAASVELPARAASHNATVEIMGYFRPAGDRIRPYLSAGPGFTRLALHPRGAANSNGGIESPGLSASTHASFRIAVGIDLRIHSGLAFRYSFSETIQANAISGALRPPGQRNLANFQNWWGLCWRFR